MKKLIIIDGHNFLWRAYSVPFKFHSAKGTPLHVVTTYLKLIRRSFLSIKGFSKSDSVVVVFDTDTINDNFELSKDYKTNRRIFSGCEESPYAHIPYIQKALDVLNIKYLEIPNVEADDVIASVVKGFCKKSPKNKAYIVSSDTDFYQLLDNQVFVLKLKNGDNYDIIKAKHIRDSLGIKPGQYVDYKSLIGDPTDNIKGINGIGKVTARKIICREINFDIEKYKEILDLNKKLITLNCNCKKQWDFRNFFYNEKVLNISNKDIFKYCGF